MKKFLSALLAACLLVTFAMGEGLTGGSGAEGVYIGKDGLYQAWYADCLAADADYIVGVSGGYAYYQTAPENGASRLVMQPLNMVSEEYLAADGTIENVTAAKPSVPAERKAVTLSENVTGKAVIDEYAGIVYYVENTDTKTVVAAADVPTMGIKSEKLLTAQEDVIDLRVTADGLAYRTASACWLYLPLQGRSVQVTDGVFGDYVQSQIYNGMEILLDTDGNLVLRLDTENNNCLFINDSVQEFAVHGGCVYYLRRTVWLTEIDCFDPVTRTSKVLNRMLKELMPQLVAAGSYLYVIDTDYVVYKMSPTSGKYAAYMKLAANYVGYDEVRPGLYSAGDQLVVYDIPVEEGNIAFFAAQYVGDIEHPAIPEPTATPDPARTPAPTEYPTMQKGSKSDDVKLLQQMLIDLGYLTGAADGSFGTRTQEAVEAMQEQNGLTVTGKVNNALMYSLINGHIAAFDPYSVLKQGDRGEKVSEMQARLQELGYLTGKVDGIYGGGTKDAVSRFQQANGLEATGTADHDTQVALYADTAKAAG